MKPKDDLDFLEEETEQERNFRRSRKTYFILIMILSFILEGWRIKLLLNYFITD